MGSGGPTNAAASSALLLTRPVRDDAGEVAETSFLSVSVYGSVSQGHIAQGEGQLDDSRAVPGRADARPGAREGASAG